MRIQTAADSLLATLDNPAAACDDTADKHLFARLLHAQPEAATATPATTDDTAPAAEAPNAVADSQSADTKQTATATTTTTKADSSTDKLAQQTQTQTAGADAASVVTTPVRLVLIPNVVLAPKLEMTKSDSTDASDATDSEHKPALEPAGKAGKSARNANANITAANADATAAATIATDSNAPPANLAALTTDLLNPAPVKPDESPATDEPSTTALTNQPLANNAAYAQQITVAADPASLALPTDIPLASGSAGSNDLATMRGAKLPPGGKSLPLAADATDAANQGSSQPVFKELTGLTQLQNPAPAADMAVLQASQNLLNATAGNSGAQDMAAAHFAANTASTPASALPISSNSSAAQAPLVLASSLALGTSGWGEETLHHIHWLKDQDQQSAEIQLHPAELGRLSISIEMKDGRASVQMMTGNAQARELLEKALPDLRNLLAQSGMSLSDSGVAQHSGGQQAWSNRFNQAWFETDDAKPVELPAGRPLLFRASPGSNRIDQYV